MGHRTLVAYDRDGYDLHYAHWAVAPDAITAETPFGGPPDDAWARRRASDLIDPQGGHVTGDAETAVDPDPVATGLSFAEVFERVDPLLHEALYLVAPDFSVRTYLVLALRAPSELRPDGEEAGTRDEPSAGHRPIAALVGYDGERDAAYLRGWLAGARAVRTVHDLEAGAVVRALRWLDPERGMVIFPDDAFET
jgi:hypothetical protein